MLHVAGDRRAARRGCLLRFEQRERVDGSGVADHPMTSGVIELRRRFDRAAWQLAPSAPAGTPTVLLTWTVEPEPIDGGIPTIIQTAVAEALCHVGPCWFAADADEHGAAPIATLGLWRGLSRRRALIFRAERAAEVRAAFESGSHAWALGAQWIIVGSRNLPSSDRILDVLRSVLRAWRLPRDWPPDVAAIIQAGVDGDGAGCRCRTPEIEQELRGALERRAIANGLGFRTID